MTNPASNRKKVGNYILLRQIGEGQFGQVFKAQHMENKESVFAIKCVPKNKLQDNQNLQRLFQTEMSVMSMINNPNVMHLYEFLETNNNYYLVLPFCNNGDLENHLKKFHHLCEEEAVYFLMQIMNGFRELHKH